MLVSLLLTASLSFAAAITASEQKTIEADCQRRISNDPMVPEATTRQSRALCVSTELTRITTDRIKSQTAELEKKGSSCEVTVDRWGSLKSWVTGTSTVDPSRTAETTAKCQDEVKKRQAQLAESKVAVSENESSLASLEKNYQAQLDAAKKTAAERKSIDDLVNKNFDQMKLSIFSAKLNNAEAAATLNNVASAIDNSVLGLYMRDRMAGLLNSDVMCAAVKQCPAKRDVKGSQLNGVFTGKMTTTAADVTNGAVAKPAPTTKTQK